MKDFFTKKEQIVILIVVLIVFLLTGYKLFLKNLFNKQDKTLGFVNQDIISQDEYIDTTDIEEETIIMVHISGQVYNPGLVELKSGSRVKDAVDLAGGLKKEADIDRINLAKKLVDEEKIYVPKRGEEIDLEISLNSESLTSNSNSKININTCSKEQLMELPGIGEVTASKIIDYRSANQFKSIEDIMNVSGIGTKKYEDLKDYIIVK
mgnify:FL=1